MTEMPNIKKWPGDGREIPEIVKWPEDRPEKDQSSGDLRDELERQKSRELQLTGDQMTLRNKERLYGRVEDALLNSLLSLTAIRAILLLAWMGDESGFRAIFGIVWALFMFALGVGMMVSWKKAVRTHAKLLETNDELRQCRERTSKLKRALRGDKP